MVNQGFESMTDEEIVALAQQDGDGRGAGISAEQV